ncbi:Polygalacturonase [Fusarium odoratissimum]|uniref:Polygalacturonase n=1 Tax=Fusarium oxysporum f. sp. cubense (strain race 4) TaxID=2502994 RepID=N1RBK5_FUSC4|nr:Polygalacturonase [Fusarium odoratissimum]
MSTNGSQIKTYAAPEGVAVADAFLIYARSVDSEPWIPVPTYAVDVAEVNTTRNEFDKHPISVASFDMDGPVEVQVKYTLNKVQSAAIRPKSLGIQAAIDGDNTITFSLDRPRDVMLEINQDNPNGGAILIERSENIVVENVTSLGATGFSLTTGEAKGVSISGYRSFSSHGNGDGVDLFCSSDILVENCFLRNSDDTIAIYGHRWDYYGDSSNIVIRNCTLLPDIAHPIHMGTHGNPAKPETISGIHISNIDILDHYENQMWYQGCISLSAGDENLIEDVHIQDVRVERISKGQLVNMRVMKNEMWTTAPGHGIRNVTLKDISLDVTNSQIVNPSQILGFDYTRKVENIVFENLNIGGQYIHDGMEKPRWYMVADLVPMFINEHVTNVKFILTK